MSVDRRRNWVLTLGIVLMLSAMFSYVASLDESDPEALESIENVNEVIR